MSTDVLMAIGWSLVAVAAWLLGLIAGFAWSDRRARRKGEEPDRGYWP